MVQTRNLRTLVVAEVVAFGGGDDGEEMMMALGGVGWQQWWYKWSGEAAGGSRAKLKSCQECRFTSNYFRTLRIEEYLRAQESDKGKGKEVVRPSVNMIRRGCKEYKTTTQNHGKKLVSMRTTVDTAIAWWIDSGAGQLTWWIDSGATTHVCKDRCWFKTYAPVEDGSVLYIGDDHFAPIHGKGSVVLEFSLGKYITLFNVLYVPNLRVFIGFGYYNNGMFMLNLNKVPDDSGSVYMSSSTVVNSSLWHARLGHVHYKRMLEMYIDDFILAIDENLEKYTTYESLRDDHSNDVSSETPKPRRGKRARKAKSYGSDFQLYLVEGSRDQIGSQYSYCYSIEEDPVGFLQLLNIKDHEYAAEKINTYRIT
ncbi:zinc finger, CCHC-type containing protein [Tanacetum coccineum]